MATSEACRLMQPISSTMIDDLHGRNEPVRCSY
jgi:hypothetical protein